MMVETIVKFVYSYIVNPRAFNFSVSLSTRSFARCCFNSAADGMVSLQLLQYFGGLPRLALIVKTFSQ
jgi:hypothetical protein